MRGGQVAFEQPGARVGERDAAALGQLDCHALEPAAHDAREAADGALGDRQVGEAVDVQVQDAAGLLLFVAVERADQREGGEVDALGGQPGLAHGGEQPFDHVALRRDQDDALARAGGGVDDAERVEVEDGVAERHRDLVLRLEGDGGGELLLVGDGRQLERAQHGALVGDADPDALAEVVLGEQLLERLGQGDLVDDFAVAHRVGGERHAGGALGDDRAVDAGADGGDEPRLDVQPDDVGAGAAAEVESELQVGRGKA